MSGGNLYVQDKILLFFQKMVYTTYKRIQEKRNNYER